MPAPTDAVLAIYDAFNRRDLDGVLALTHPEIELHPLRMSPRGPWRGRDGIRELFGEMQSVGLRHRFDIDRTHTMADGRIASFGAVVAEDVRTPFVGIHRVDDGLVRSTHHYFSDPETLRHLGLLEV